MEHDTPAAPAAPAVRVKVVEDDLFGPVTVSLDLGAGAVVVHGDAVPPVELRRDAAVSAIDEHVPVGTRDGASLTLVVDGSAVPIRPGKGRLTRHSFRVDVAHGEVVYRLVPDSLAGSRLLRDGEPIGGFTSDGDGAVLVEWRDGVGVRAVEVGLGYALAAAFGTGAGPMWLLVLEALGDLITPG
ncbi:hypothetical protein [Streptomyces kanasensis]|uniref:hypothetical protein n=1 Tax=Streptomyces kanasensis TaxID=936756 RepID=UPI0036F93EA1